MDIYNVHKTYTICTNKIQIYHIDWNVCDIYKSNLSTVSLHKITSTRQIRPTAHTSPSIFYNSIKNKSPNTTHKSVKKISNKQKMSSIKSPPFGQESHEELQHKTVSNCATTDRISREIKNCHWSGRKQQVMKSLTSLEQHFNDICMSFPCGIMKCGVSEFILEE